MLNRQINSLKRLAELRRKAETLEMIASQSKEVVPLSPEEIQGALHELRVHQIELEMQNEELRRIQHELDTARERYFNLYDLAPVGYCTLNENGQILETNLTLSTLIGITRQHLIKKQFSQFILSEDQPLFYQFRSLVKESKESKDCELRMIQADKSIFWVQISATVATDLAYRVVVVDITERKLAQQAIKCLNEELEAKVRIRTSDLENSTNAMKSFSYTVSHDLRSPLRAIDGFSAILEEEYQEHMDAEGKRLLKVIRDNARQMNQLIVDLLDLAKVTNFELKKIPIDMNQLVKAVYQEFVSEEDRKRILFKADNLLECYGDPNMIHQVWTNLLSNAVKFTRKQERPTIEVQNNQTQNQTVYLVKDNGCGFNPAYKNKLFTAFSRLHTDAAYEGAGIGLVIVDRIILRHGGNVWAEGTPGQGATFYFSLPKGINEP